MRFGGTVFKSLMVIGLTAACSRDVTAPAPLVVDPSFDVTVVPGKTGTITISANIDGRSELILSGSTAQWHHLDYDGPGLWSGFGSPRPTTINGVEWYPTWPTPGTQSFCNCLSSIYTGISPALPRTSDPLTLTVLNARVTPTIVQQPSADNDFTTIVDFNDDGPFGPDLYSIQLSFSSPSLTLDPGGPYSGHAGSAIAFDASNSSSGFTDYSWDFGDKGTAIGPQATHKYSTNGTYTVTLSASGPGGKVTATTTAVIANAVPILNAFTPAPLGPVPVGTNINVNASFTDADLADTHTARVNWDDGQGWQDASAFGTLLEDAVNGGGSVSLSHAYAQPGVYAIQLQVADNGGETSQIVTAGSQATTAYVVVYDASAGFVTGGGWINSRAGSYTDNVNAAGKATFGFVSKYQAGATNPQGHTEFDLHVANLNFQSSSYQWLVINGNSAQYTGVGTVNGAGNYSFSVTATKGTAGGADTFRIQIIDVGSGRALYDSGVSPLGGGSVNIKL